MLQDRSCPGKRFFHCNKLENGMRRCKYAAIVLQRNDSNRFMVYEKKHTHTDDVPRRQRTAKKPKRRSNGSHSRKSKPRASTELKSIARSKSMARLIPQRAISQMHLPMLAPTHTRPPQRLTRSKTILPGNPMSHPNRPAISTLRVHLPLAAPRVAEAESNAGVMEMQRVIRESKQSIVIRPAFCMWSKRAEMLEMARELNLQFQPKRIE